MVKQDGFDMKDMVFSRAIADELKKHADKVLAQDAILSIDSDVLVLAALEDSVDGSNQSDITASIILELANGPLDTTALDALETRNIHVIPDVIANAGGVIVSYLEWKQNKSVEHWTEARVNRELERIMSQAMKATNERSHSEGVSLKQAAFMNALERLVK